MTEAVLLEKPTGSSELDSRPGPTGGVPTALLVECTCPEWCERDHDRD